MWLQTVFMALFQWEKLQWEDFLFFFYQLASLRSNRL